MDWRIGIIWSVACRSDIGVHLGKFPVTREAFRLIDLKVAIMVKDIELHTGAVT
jgi:hypothetical protein